MNKRGSLAIAIMTSIFIFIIGMAVINLLLPEVTNFRINMNCGDASAISDGTKLMCLAGGAAIPYFIMLVFSISIGGIVSRLIF